MFRLADTQQIKINETKLTRIRLLLGIEYILVLRNSIRLFFFCLKQVTKKKTKTLIEVWFYFNLIYFYKDSLF